MRKPALSVLAAVVGLGALCDCGKPSARTPPGGPGVGATGATPPAASGCGGYAPAIVDAELEGQVVELVNAQRRERGLVELRSSAALADAARLHAHDMSVEDYLDHDSFDRSSGKLVRSCEWSERVLRFTPGKPRLAENIASGAQTPREVVEGWMESPVHRRNVLGTAFNEIGVGYWPGGSAGFYWVADFGGD